MGPDDVNVQSFLSGITHDLANQHPTFGRHLNQVRFESKADFEEMLTAFVKDVEELSDEPFLLILTNTTARTAPMICRRSWSR